MSNKRSGFDLKELLNQRSLQQQEETTEQQPGTEEDEMEIVMLDVYDLIPSKENFYNTENIKDLKFSIGLLGVLQPLLVQPDGDKYKIKAGHRRCLACIALVEEEKLEKFRLVPCVIRTEEERKDLLLGNEGQREEEQKQLETIMGRLTLIMANSFRDKSDWEKMEEALQQEALIEELRKTVKMEGRTRTILKEFTGGKVKEAQMGRYKAIRNNLCLELMEEFKADNIGISTIYEASGLSVENQQQAYELYRENGCLTGLDIKKLKQIEEEHQQIPGQIEWPERQQEAQEGGETEKDQAEDQEMGEDPLEGRMNQPEEDRAEGQEEFEPKPEYINSLCYSCQHYSTCHVKTGTVKECDTYVDKAEAEKTEEQRYSEKQDRIDRETKKEMQRQQDEERMQQLPGERKPKIHVIRFPASQWNDVTQEIQTFLLLKGGDYRVGDELNMQEYKGGEFTGGIVDAKITYMINEHSGLVEGFCIVGIKVIRCSS